MKTLVASWKSEKPLLSLGLHWIPTIALLHHIIRKSLRPMQQTIFILLVISGFNRFKSR